MASHLIRSIGKATASHPSSRSASVYLGWTGMSTRVKYRVTLTTVPIHLSDPLVHGSSQIVDNSKMVPSQMTTLLRRNAPRLWLDPSARYHLCQELTVKNLGNTLDRFHRSLIRRPSHHMIHAPQSLAIGPLWRAKHNIHLRPTAQNHQVISKCHLTCPEKIRLRIVNLS